MGKRARIVGFVALVVGVLAPVAAASASQYVALGGFILRGSRHEGVL